MKDTYRSDTRGFEIQKPSQWDVEENDESHLTLTMTPPGLRENGKSQVHFVIAVPSATGMAADHLPLIREGIWKGTLGDTYKKITEGDSTLSGEPGARLSFISDKGEKSIRWEEHYVLKNGFLYLMQSMAPVSAFDSFRVDFDFILDSFKLIELSQGRDAFPNTSGAVEREKGTVIFLNGASSSGKTTIAKKLQGILSKTYLWVSIDGFMQQLPAGLDPKRLEREMPILLAGFNASAAAVARAGNNIIVDHVLWQQPWVLPCIEAYEGVDVIFVGLRCSLEALEAREKERGDRIQGIARIQHESTHIDKTYDVEIDTSQMPVDECARVICEYVESGRKPKAFRKLGATAS